MTEFERRLKKAEENEKARQSTGKGKTSTQTGRSAASSSSGRSDTERRLRIAEAQDRKYSAPAANRRAALQRKTESFMEATTEAEPEARAAIDRYKATEDAKYYAAMNQHGAAIGDDAMLERGRSGYERSSDQWRASYDKGPQASQPVAAQTPERAARNRNYWAEAAKQAAQFGDQARYGKAMENVAEADRDARNASALRQKEYERQLEALRQSNPAEYYALTMTDDEIDRMIAYFDYEDKNNAGRSGYGVTRTPEEEARYLNNLRRARFAGESDAERAAYIRAEQERYEAASKSYENRRTVMDDTTGRTLRTVADDPHWVEYFDRTPEEQAEYLNNLRRARFVGESDAEREAYIQGEKDRYAEQLRNYQNGPDYSSNLATDMINADSNIKALELAKSIHELERVDKSPANIEAGRAALREQQGRLLTENKFYYDKKTMSRLATGAGPADSKDYQEMIDKGYVLYTDFYELPADQQNNVYAVAATDPEKAVSLAQHYLKLAEDEHYQKIHDWVNKDSGWQFGRRALGMVGGAAAKLASGLDPYGTMGQGMSKAGNALISGGAASASRNGLFGIEFLGGDESGISSDVPFIGKGQAGLSYQVGASVLQSVATAVPAIIAGNYSAAASKVAETIGLVLMGSSAAADDYTQCIENGMTVDQARLHATAAGVAEAAFERISLENLIHPELTTNALKRWLQQAGIEASEEVCTSLANRISDELLTDIYGVESAVDRRTRELVADGLSYNAARDKAENEWIADVIQDGMSGFLSGLIMGGGSEVMRGVETFRLNRASRNTQTPMTFLQQEAATDSAELPGGTEQATVGVGSVQQNAAEAQNQQSTEMEQGRSDAQYMESDELDSAVEHWDGILESARGENNQEIIDRYAGYVAGLKQVQQERADLNQRRLEAGDDLGLAEGLGRVGVEQVNPGQAATGSQADYGGQRMPATAEQNGGMNHERIQGGSQIGGDSGQIARTADDGQLAARTAGPADSGQRDAGLGTDRQAGGLGEGTGRSVAGGAATQELYQLRNQVRALEAERRSAAQIGVNFGSKNESLRVVPEELYTSAMRAEQARAEENGVRLTYVTGGAIEIRGKGGRILKADGLHQVDADGVSHIFARADSKRFTPEQLTRHEDFHDMVANNRGLLLDMVEALYETQGEEGVARLVDAYVTALDGCYGVYTEGMTEDDQRALAMLYLEEIFADQYAGMNRSSGEARRAAELAGGVAQRFAGDIENARQNRAGIDRRNGPGTRLSIEADTELEEKNITDGKAAVMSLIEQAKTSDDPESLVIENAMYRSDIGYIDIKWGTPGRGSKFKGGYGLSHIIEKRNAETGDGEKVAYQIVEAIAKATTADAQYSNQVGQEYHRIRLHYNGVTAVLSKEPGNNHWLLSGWNENETEASANGEVHDSSAATAVTPTRTRRNGDATVSNNNIAQSSAESNTSEENNPNAVDWEGNREQRLSVSEDADGIDLSRYTGKDRVYMEAVKNGNTDEAAWMVEDAAKRAGFSHKGFHQTGADFTSFSTKNEVAGQFDDETPTGIFIKPTDEDIGLQSGTKQMPLYFKADNMLEFANREEIRKYWIENVQGYRELDAQLQARNRELEQQYDELDAEWDRVYQETYDSDDQSALDDVDRRQDEFLERWNRELQPLRRQMKNLVTEYMKGTDYDGIHLKYDGKVYGGPRVETYIVFNPEQTKSAEPIVRDDSGNVIPPSERFRTDRTGDEEWKNNDIRFSPSDADDDSLGVDWIGSREEGETKTQAVTETDAPHSSPAATPSPEGEGSETGGQAARVTENAQAMAREKKVSIAEKASIEGLKSRIDSAETRLRALNEMEATGLLAKDAQSQKEWKQQIKDVEESLDIFRNALDDKKAKRKAAKEAEKNNKELKAQRKQARAAEKKALQKEAEQKAGKPKEARREFRQDALNLFSVPAGKRQTLGNILNDFADRMLEQGSVTETDRQDLFRQLYESGAEIAGPADDTLQDIRDFVKSGRINVPQEVRNEFGDDWIDFNERAWANRIYLTRDANDRGIDSWNAELAEAFPGSFDPNETDMRTILENIVELAEEGKGERVTIAEMMRRNEAQTGQTMDEQMDELERKMDRLIDTFAQKAHIEAKVRTRETMKLVRERQRNREQLERQRERRKEIETRREVMDQIAKLKKMRKRVSPDFQGKIDDLIGRLDPDGSVGIKGMYGVIDTQARSISSQGLEDLPALARQYEEYKKTKSEDFIPNKEVERRINRLKEIQLDSLTLDDVITLGEAVSSLVTQIQNKNKLLADERHGEVSASAGKVNAEVKDSRGKMIGERFWAGEMLDMPRYIQHLTGWKRGGEGERFANLLQKATTEESAYISGASALFDEFKKSKENLDWLKTATGRNAKSIEIKVPVNIGNDTNGNATVEWQTFEITPMMRVALLMHSRNYENLQHIAETGIEIPKLEDFRKGKMEDALSGVDPVRMAPSTVKAIVKDCTPQERAFANVLAVYFDVYAKEKINNVSLQLDGFYRANVEHYFPIDSARDYLGGGNDYVAFDRSLESIGSLKERKNGINPIVLGDALDIASRHMGTFARYTAFAIPMRDFNEVFSYVFHEEGNPFAGSVMHTIGKKFGPSGPKSIKQIQAALAQQNPASDEVFMKWLRKIRGRIASANLSGNVRVMASQFASMPYALPYLDAVELLSSFDNKVDTEIRDKYSPISQFRRGGYINQELGDLKSEHPLLNSIPVVMTGITDVDTFTINRLWAAAVNHVSRTTDLKPGSREQVLSGNDEFYQKVAEIYTEAVYKTQPNYTTVQRPALLRDSNDLLRNLLMYKTVPFQVYGMLAEATERLANDRARYRANKTAENEKNLKASWKFYRKTQVGVLTGTILYVAIRALIGGGLFREKKYRDEKGKMTLESVAKALGKDLIDTYAGSFVGASELLAVFDKATGNSSYNNKIFNDISSLGEIEKAANVFINSYKAITEKDWQQGKKAIKDAAQEISGLGFGFPAKNIEKFMLSTTKWIAPEWADRYENFFDEYERGDLDDESRRFLNASVRVLMDNRTDGLSDDTIEELSRLWENGETMHIPSGLPTSIKVGDEEKKVSASMREDYRDAWNKVVSANLEKLLASDAYEAADDRGKAKMIAKLYEYAKQQADASVAGMETDAWVELGKACEAAGIPLTDYLTVASVDKENLKDMDGEALDSAIRSRMEFRVGDLDEKTLDELGRLFANGASGAIPSDVPTSVSVSGEERKLTPEERVAWLQAWKRIAGEGLEGLISSGAYKTADDAGKAKMLSALYDIARASASSEVVNGYAPDKWVSVGMEAAERGVPIDEYASFHVGMSGLKTAEKLALLKGQRWSDNQKEFIWTELMATDTQYSKYQNLKNAGMKWADAMEQLGIGAASTTPSGLTDAQQAQYDKYWNEISGPATQQLLNNADYKKADKAGQAAFLDRLNDYAARVAKAKVLSGYDKGKWVECGERLVSAGVSLDDYIVYCEGTSDANNRAKYEALAKTGWTEKQKLIAMENISESVYNTGKIGRDYQVPLTEFLGGLANADADQSGSINQDEAEAWLDRTSLGWEDKAYLWQMLCYSSKWKNNPYSAKLGEEIWHSLHPED